MNVPLSQLSCLFLSYSCLVNISIIVVENAQKVSPWSSIDLFHVGPLGLCEWLIKRWLKEPNDWPPRLTNIYDPNLCIQLARQLWAVNIMILTKCEKILHWVVAKSWAANLWHSLLGYSVRSIVCGAAVPGQVIRRRDGEHNNDSHSWVTKWECAEHITLGESFEREH